MKTCTRCNKTKPLDAFNRHTKSRDGRQARCADCQREVNRAYVARNRTIVEGFDPYEAGGERTCRKCGLTKPVAEFALCRSRRDGLQLKCKACNVEESAQRRELHRAKHTGGDPYKPGVTKKCTGCQTVKPAEAFSRNRAQPDGLASHCRECFRPLQRKHQAENPDVYRAAGQRRRARLAGVEGNGMTVARREQLIERWGWRCYWCDCELHDIGLSRPDSAQADHVFPIASERPSNRAEHMVYACRQCNVGRKNTPPLEFASRMWGVEFDGVSWAATTQVLDAVRSTQFPPTSVRHQEVPERSAA